MASKPSDTQASQREARLSKLLHAYIKEGKELRTARDGKLLLEAVSAQSDGATCVERFVASKNALEALRLALRFDRTPDFFNTTLKNFLTFLQNPAIKQLCGGDLLKQLLTMIVCPETLWVALIAAYSNTQLSCEGELAFAWLLLELASWVKNSPLKVDSIARDLTERKVFINSDDRNLRAIGYRLENILQTSTSAKPTADDGPGGRHDNDHANFRRVAIFPTDDELMCTEQAFYQVADAMTQQPFKQRSGAHLDNQFRLLREDFLAEIREGVKTSQDNAKGGQRQRFRLRGLSLVGAHYGTERFRTSFALILSVKSGLDSFARLGKNRRKAYLKDNPKFMKHQSFGCVIDHKRVVAFVTVLRVEELLVGGSDDDDDCLEPRVVIRAPDKTSLEKLLTALISSRDAEFVMIDAPVFAYEPVLRCLQSTVELPLWQELFATSGEEIEAAVRLSEVAPLDIIRKIEGKGGFGLQSTLSLPKPVDLDASQLGSLLAGLRQSVSLTPRFLMPLPGGPLPISTFSAVLQASLRQKTDLGALLTYITGTGKTTTARKMGKIYYDMGFLATAEVVECSAKDLVGQYVGQTGPKAQALIESALGKVLFIDEAYRLGQGAFGREAIDELVDCVTKPRFLNKLVIILAGYDAEINEMIQVNPGLPSRFSHSINFKNLNAESCYQLLRITLEKHKQLDVSTVSEPSAIFFGQVVSKFNELGAFDNFANGRDVGTVSQGIFNAIMKVKKGSTGDARKVTEKVVIDQIDLMIAERTSHSQSARSTIATQAGAGTLPMQTEARDPQAPPATTTTTSLAVRPQVAIADATEEEPTHEPHEDNHGNNPKEAAISIRDASVNDAIWNQLQLDAEKAEEEKRENRRLAEKAEELRLWLKKCADAKLQRELEEVERKKRELEEKLRREAREQAKLAEMGICPAGFHWIKQSGGYRCAGGAHWVSGSEMDKMCG